MIRLEPSPLNTIGDVRDAVQRAIQLEFATLPPYLYALFTIRQGTNMAAHERLSGIVRDEMVHMGLACNMLNAIGGAPKVADASFVPTYPGPLPHEAGDDDADQLLVSLVPFSERAVEQGLRIEEPEDPQEYPDEAGAAPSFLTIGQFYAALADSLSCLPPEAWVDPSPNQLADDAYFPGKLFAVTSYDDAARAIERIVSEGEGTTRSPLDFESEVAHYYRFEEIRRNRVLQEDAAAPDGFSWGEPLDVDWAAVVPAIADPGTHDFSGDPEPQAAQEECDRVFTRMLQELERAVNGEPERFGRSVGAMFRLTAQAADALAIPLKDNERSAGPAFRFRPELV